MLKCFNRDSRVSTSCEEGANTVSRVEPAVLQSATRIGDAVPLVRNKGVDFVPRPRQKSTRFETDSFGFRQSPVLSSEESWEDRQAYELGVQHSSAPLINAAVGYCGRLPFCSLQATRTQLTPRTLLAASCHYIFPARTTAAEFEWYGITQRRTFHVGKPATSMATAAPLSNLVR